MIVIFIFASLLLTGYIYQNVNVKNEIKSYQPVGKLFDVNNYKMHLFTGGAGDVTVVFAAGWGTVNPYADFAPLYQGVSEYARFAVYDRFGYGYSEITDNKRDIDSVVNEIHTLLVNSEVKPPYVFVGHSLGSLETIRFAQLYPNEVKGLVLIDGGSPEYYAAHKPITGIGLFQNFLIKFGIARVLFQFDGVADYLNDERNKLKLLSSSLKELDQTSTLIKGANKNMIDEMRQSQKNAGIVVKGVKPLSVPITVITAGSFGHAAADWRESQKKLTEWSTNGKQLLVNDSAHYIHHYHPEIINSEIRSLVVQH